MQCNVCNAMSPYPTFLPYFKNLYPTYPTFLPYLKNLYPTYLTFLPYLKTLTLLTLLFTLLENNWITFTLSLPYLLYLKSRVT